MIVVRKGEKIRVWYLQVFVQKFYNNFDQIYVERQRY